jgi:serine/threonine-protein kinase
MRAPRADRDERKPLDEMPDGLIEGRVLRWSGLMSDSGRVKSPVAPGDIVAGKYRVERVLGSGGMGVVVAARHIDLDQPVALKFILPHALAGKGNVERFMREARAAVRLKSEHVARVYDVGRDTRDGEDRPFMVLELLEGMDLAKLTKTKGSLPVADAVEYVLQACEALVEAHAAGIVHRDLKPQNLFVTRRLNGTPLLKVLDFGIAKAIGPGAVGQMALTDSAAIIGSPLYMAPEQMRSARTAEIRSDIWALGVILYELLGGQIPFDGETVTEVCIRVVNEEPTPLVELRPALDPALVKIVMRCLAKEPEGRFHNVAALAAALEPFSRSAKQGGPVRPWRSFEDTQDSQDGSNPFAAAFAEVDPADATGPSTAVTMDSLPPLDDASASSASSASSAGQPSEEERRARALAGSTKASAGSRRPNDPAAAPLVSTDVTWGESSDLRAAASRPGRSFSTGMVAGIVVAVAAAAVALGLFLGRGSSGVAASATAAAQAPSQANGVAGSEGDAKAKTEAAAKAQARADADAKAKAEADAKLTNKGSTSSPEPAATAIAPTRVPTPATSASVAARLLSAGKARGTGNRPIDPNAAASAAAAPTSARPPEARPSDPLAPNGAPILH